LIQKELDRGTLTRETLDRETLILEIIDPNNLDLNNIDPKISNQTLLFSFRPAPAARPSKRRSTGPSKSRSFCRQKYPLCSQCTPLNAVAAMG
jgi:hypothetical protein